MPNNRLAMVAPAIAIGMLVTVSVGFATAFPSSSTSSISIQLFFFSFSVVFSAVAVSETSVPNEALLFLRRQLSSFLRRPHLSWKSLMPWLTDTGL